MKRKGTLFCYKFLSRNRHRECTWCKPVGIYLGFKVFYTLKNGVKKLLDIFLFNAGKGHTEITGAKGNETHTVFFQKMNPEWLGFNGLQFQSHEISRIERIDIPGLLIFWVFKDFSYFLGTFLQDKKFPLLFCMVVFRLQRPKHDFLAQVGGIGY